MKQTQGAEVPGADESSVRAGNLGGAPTRVGWEGAWLLIALFALALALRLPGIGGDLWLDEVATLIHFVRIPAWDLLSTYTSANNHVLYSLLAHGSIALFGESSWALRLPALLFGAAGAPALYVLTREYLDRREALASALLLAVSYQHVYFSQSARGYTGLLLLAFFSTFLLTRALRTDRTAYWALYALTTTVNIYLLLSAFFVCVGQVLGALIVAIVPAGRPVAIRRLRRLTIWVGVAGLLSATLYAPLLAHILHTFATADVEVGWRPSLELLKIILRDAAPSPVVLVGALLAIPVALLGLGGLVRRAPLLFFGLAVPPTLEFAATLALGAGTYPRRLLLLFPFGLLVAVHGSAILSDAAARWLARPWLRSGVFGSITLAAAVVLAAALPRLYGLPMQDYTGALAFVEEHKGPEDVVAGAYLAEPGVRYYEPGAHAVYEPEELEALLAGGRRVWLIGTFLGDLHRKLPELEALIAQNFDEVERFPGLVGDGDMVVWKSRAP